MLGSRDLGISRVFSRLFSAQRNVVFWFFVTFLWFFVERGCDNGVLDLR